jgi:uncharacterized protein (DUF488 family)
LVVQISGATSLFTIGYEGLSFERFVALLIENGIETLVDVRELPLSRKAGFSKKVLALQLSGAGIAYVHIVRLGCPKVVRDAYRDDNNWARYTRRFMTHLHEQHEAVRELATIARERRSALMCYEADYLQCHRSMVAEAVVASTCMAVTHLR